MHLFSKMRWELTNSFFSFPYPNESSYSKTIESFWAFHIPLLSQDPYGYIPNFVVEAMPWTSSFHLDSGSKIKRVILREKNIEGCNGAISAVLERAREKDSFDVLKGWRGEEYGIRGDGGVRIERAGAGLFGVVTTGVHCTVYTFGKRNDGEKELLLWVPRRSVRTKRDPGMLDSSIAGGVTAGMEPRKCLIKEAFEEASLGEEIAERARGVGCVMEFNVKGEGVGKGLTEPSLKFVYDLEVDEGVVLKPGDEEVEGFRLMGVEEVVGNIREGRYKAMCVMVLVDFLIRHGWLIEEEGYGELVARTHRFLPFPC